MPEQEEREKLAERIRRWNSNRPDLFEISPPDENLEFHGVMRFYFEDHAGGSVATKCVRVCSNSSACEVIEALSEKFRPDMKMLTTSYSLYEIHADKERKLDLDERPLVEQLHWTTDDREGRFVLKAERLEGICHDKDRGGVIQNFKRTLSRKDKKQKIKADEDSVEDGLSEKQLNSSSTCDIRRNKTQQEVKLTGSLNPDVSDQPGLPVRVTFPDRAEDAFLSAVINCASSSTVHFRLSPAYVLYAALCSRASPPSGHGVALTAKKMVAMATEVIQGQRASAGALAFWTANSSELLNFLQRDRDLRPLTQQSQLDLSRLVRRAYSYLLQCLQCELRKHLPTFLIDPEHHGPLPAGIEMVLNTLMNSMALLRRCRVNPAFNIQLFSQLFHFISAWLFNQLMRPEPDTLGLRSHYWGAALRQRLMAIEAWAERQGLDLAADCHLGHIVQATTLLTMNKYSVKDATAIQNTCFKLNSLQLQALLVDYLYAADEPHIPAVLIDAVVMAAEASADKLIRSAGRDIQLEESLDLHLPFLLPEGGYSCDTERGIPPGFREFLEPICKKGICSLTSQLNSKGDWNVYFGEPTSADSPSVAAHREPEIVTVTLKKPLKNGMGVSIVAAKGAGQSNLGIYIKSIVKGGPAEMNGRLTAGDQLLRVDGQSLVGLSQERAAAIMMQTGPVVTLQVAKFGASYHGLWALLSGPASEWPAARGDENRVHTSGKALGPHSVVDCGPHGQPREKKKEEQIMQRKRQLSQSNPNITTNLGPEGGDEPVVRTTNMAAVSSSNLCADIFHRDYLTLPTPKSRDNNMSKSSRPQQMFKVTLHPLDGQSSSKRTLMRQALSQDNLCLDTGGPLLDKRQNSWDQHAKQTTSHDSSFPIRSSVSTHDIFSDRFHTKRQQGSRTSGAGVWRTPFSQHATPSNQPIRIDIPVTRAANVSSNPPLTTFQSSKSRTVNENKVQNQAHHIYSTPATKKLLSQQHRPSTHRDQAAKLQVTITPTKHVSFQEPPTQQEHGSGPAKQELPDPWRREAQEKLKKQQRLHAVDLLEQEVEELQAKAKRTEEESKRLRKLSLEWQFQKRLQEIQQRGEEEEEDEDLDMMLTIQQLGTRIQNQSSSPEYTTPNQAGTHLSQKEDKAKTDLRLRHQSQDFNMASKKHEEEKIKRASAPEKLTFKERQHLFSLASSA